MASGLLLHMNSRMEKLMNWEIAVAMAAPAVPRPSTKMKIGSSTMLIRPPVLLPIMP